MAIAEYLSVVDETITMGGIVRDGGTYHRAISRTALRRVPIAPARLTLR
jgi:hypothetical protein